MCAATYLDDAGDDAAGGVAIADDGTIWYAGSRSGDDLGATPTAIMGRGDGVVLHPSGDGRALLSITRIGSHVDDVAVIPGGDAIAVVGDFGVAVLEDGATTLAWSAQTSGDASGVAAAADGRVAVVHDQSLARFDASGALVADASVGGAAVNDVVVHRQRRDGRVAGGGRKRGGRVPPIARRRDDERAADAHVRRDPGVGGRRRGGRLARGVPRAMTRRYGHCASSTGAQSVTQSSALLQSLVLHGCP